MERYHVGTSSNGTRLWGGYKQNVRTYYDQMIGGNLVAIAVSQDDFNKLTRYFCLPEVWDEGPDTFWVSKEALLKMYQPAASAV